MTSTTTNTVRQFNEWLMGFVDEVGDAPTAIGHLKVLSEIKKQVVEGMRELEKIITESTSQTNGPIETPLGAVNLRTGAERHKYPAAKSDENERFIETVIARVIDSVDPDLDMRPTEQVAKGIVAVFPCTVSSARVQPTKDLGLNLYDYGKQSIGKKTSVEVL